MKARHVLSLAVLVLLLAACGQSGAGASGSGSGDTVGAPQPFAAFVADVRSARFADYAGRSGVAVANAQDFEHMRAYLLQRYDGMQVARSYVSGGAVFDCQGTATGSSSAAGCPVGTVPVRRTTVSDLVRFPTLAAFLGKSPDGSGGLPPTS